MKLLRQRLYSDDDNSVRNASIAGLGAAGLGTTAGYAFDDLYVEGKRKSLEKEGFKKRDNYMDEIIEKSEDAAEANRDKAREINAYKKSTKKAEFLKKHNYVKNLEKSYKKDDGGHKTFDSFLNSKKLDLNTKVITEKEAKKQATEKTIKEFFKINRPRIKNIEDAAKESSKKFEGKFRKNTLIGTAIAAPTLAAAAYKLSENKEGN